MKIDRAAHMKMLIDNERSIAPGCSLAGVDEVGRGPLAGCVMAACVMLPDGYQNPWIDDSKKLSESRRKKVFDDIIANALFIGVGRAEAEEIDCLNILNATKRAMNMAIQDCPAELLLVDAVKNLDFPKQQIDIVHGDALSYHIAAASIVAKVMRDMEMQKLHFAYPMYGFANNKGYGTKAHIEALKKYGPCPLHRKSFIGSFV